MIEIDHLGYLSSRQHRRQVALALRRLMRSGRRQGIELVVTHEHDDRCCALEEWPVTALRIQNALALDGDRVGWVFADPAGVTLVAPQTEAAQ